MKIEGKTVLDFAKSQKMIDYFLEKYKKSSVDELREYLKTRKIGGTLNDISELAEITNDRQLLQEVAEFRKSILQKTTDRMNETGYIID